MDGLFPSLESYIARYGYWAVFAAVLLEDFGVPFPGETMLIAGALLASQGDLHIGPLLFLAWLAAIIGDNIGYGIGSFLGRRIVLRYGRRVGVTGSGLDYAEGFFRKYGGSVVVFARFIEVLRQLNGIVAGTAHMQWKRFLLYNALGGGLWVGFWGMLSYKLGERIGNFKEYFTRFEYAVAGLLLLGLAFLLFYWLKRRRR